jgi:uroporphyrin-III C-methyltransferase/precorrin-2 dehydrogenase/sirohydrochlorin ferrochelatase
MRAACRKPSEVAPGRLGALAKLPVFLDLAAKPALVAGGSPAAAWKAELLAAAGAAVAVHAVDPGPDLLALVDRGAAAGSITLHRSAWTAAAFAGTAIAVADIADPAEAADFAAAARAAGVPVNVVDTPALCEFQFGSIVNRSPVVIGISTDGAAPILGQAVRRRIETVLHPALAHWAALAKSMRATVMERLAPGAARRAFWERFSDRALAGDPPDAATEAAMLDGTSAGPSAGRVTLVGAGPGDAELLTLKALRALQAADVILFDDLVSAEVLKLARREARRMLVGKRGGRASCVQEDINDLMVRLARQGKHVVRLKSGDPMIFGRAGEEIEKLDAAGISLDVVPGITAGMALAATLGVSLTHRDLAQSVRFVTGCARTGDIPGELDWRGLADGRTSIIFYMAARRACGIAKGLMKEGLPADTPAVAIAGVSRHDEHRWTGRLDALGAAAAGMAGGAPVVLGIGQVFGCRAAAAMSDGWRLTG